MLNDIFDEEVSSLERYNINLDSSKSKRFIKDLTDAIHDVRDKINKDKIKFEKTSTLFKSIDIYYDKKISKIINDYTGFNCMFVVDSSNEYNAFYSPKINKLGHDKDFLSTKGMTTGRGDVLLSHNEALSRIKELNKISHSDDLKLIDNNITEELFNYFLVTHKGLFSNKDFKDEEIVAIILHEIGHAISFITETTQEFHSSSMWREVVEYSTDDDRSLEELKDILDEIIEIKKEIKEDHGKQDTSKGNVINSLPLSIRILNKLYVNKLNKTLNIQEKFFLQTFIGVIIASLVNLFIIRSIRSHLNNDKYGDKLGDSYDIAFHERWADEYVAEHGMGAYSASGLKKMYSLHSSKSRLVKEVGLIAYVAQHTYKFFYIYNSIKSIIEINNSMKIKGEHIPYDSIMGRAILCRKNTYKLFKNKDLSSNTKKILSEQIKMIDKEIEEIKKMKNIKINPITRKWLNILDRLISNDFVLTPGDKLSKDLEKFYFDMHNRSETFIKNRFDYKQYEIDTRIKKINK